MNEESLYVQELKVDYKSFDYSYELKALAIAIKYRIIDGTPCLEYPENFYDEHIKPHFHNLSEITILSLYEVVSNIFLHYEMSEQPFFLFDLNLKPRQKELNVRGAFDKLIRHNCFFFSHKDSYKTLVFKAWTFGWQLTKLSILYPPGLFPIVFDPNIIQSLKNLFEEQINSGKSKNADSELLQNKNLESSKNESVARIEFNENTGCISINDRTLHIIKKKNSKSYVVMKLIFNAAKSCKDSVVAQSKQEEQNECTKLGIKEVTDYHQLLKSIKFNKPLKRMFWPKTTGRQLCLRKIINKADLDEVGVEERKAFLAEISKLQPASTLHRK